MNGLKFCKVGWFALALAILIAALDLAITILAHPFSLLGFDAYIVTVVAGIAGLWFCLSKGFRA